MIDTSERELILFTIALHEFSISDPVIKDYFHEKSISDLIFLVIHIFDKVISFKQSFKLRVLYMNFLHKIE